MQHYTPEAIPDDPYRVAPPYCAPGEVEPPEPPRLYRGDAVSRLIDVLSGKEKLAFGDNSDRWLEVLADDLIEEQFNLIFGLLADNQKILREIHDYLCKRVEKRANDLAAEMDADALKREGVV